MPQFLRIKTENDHIFREGTFPDMQSVVMTDAAVKPVQRIPFPPSCNMAKGKFLP